MNIKLLRLLKANLELFSIHKKTVEEKVITKLKANAIKKILLKDKK